MSAALAHLSAFAKRRKNEHMMEQGAQATCISMVLIAKQEKRVDSQMNI
jgi:hypothetical protein